MTLGFTPKYGHILNRRIWELEIWNLQLQGRIIKDNYLAQSPTVIGNLYCWKVYSLHWAEISNIMSLEGASGGEDWHLESLSLPKQPFPPAHWYLQCHQVLYLVEGKVWMTSYWVPIHVLAQNLGQLFSLQWPCSTWCWCSRREPQH